MGKSLKLLAVMVGSLAFTAFLFRHQDSDPIAWVTVGVVMLIIFIPFAVPSIGTFIAQRPHTVFWVGVAMIVAGFVAMLGVFFVAANFRFPSGVTGTDPISTAMIWIIMAGIALTILPRSMASSRRSQKAAAEPKTNQTAKKEFGGIDEAWSAIRTVVHDWRPFARLVGPWVFVLWAAPFVGLHIFAFSNGATLSLFNAPIGKIDPATKLASEGLPLIAASAFAFPIALVNWHRYILAGSIPKIGLSAPLAVTVRYLWRLWTIVLLFSILVRLVASNAPDVAEIIGSPDKQLVAGVLFWSAFCFEVYLGSSFALVLPAAAMGNRDFLGMDSLRMSKPLGSSFRMGFALSLLPFVLACWFVAGLLDRFAVIGPSSTLAGYSLWLMPTALMFLALVSCATYLSRIYAARLTIRPAEVAA